MTHNDSHKTIERLLRVMQTLRAPEGCPWDTEQTPESLTPYILEEACELIDAIESGSTELILDELGDLLLQVVFQAQIFAERGQFEFSDIATAIADKLVRRHPHVFNRESGCHSKDLDQQWDEIKRGETTQQKSCLEDHLPNRLPSLQRAQKLISKIYRSKLEAYLPPKPVRSAQPLDEVALGQALFELVKRAHASGIDAETALRKITRQTMCQIESLKTDILNTDQPEPSD